VGAVAKKDKKGKGKIPKTVAGVKVPKALRKGLTASLLDNPRTRELLADVLLAAAGAAAAALVKNRRQVAGAGAGAAAVTRDIVQDAAGAVTDAVAETARRILPDSLTGDEDSRSGRNERYAYLADKGQKGKKDKQRAKASKH